MDASPARSKILQKMVSVAGADDLVTVLAGQDFLALDPSDERFGKVSGLLLDPSCSGSGIIGRDDVPSLILPTVSGSIEAATMAKTTESRGGAGGGANKKRKRKELGDKNAPSTETGKGDPGPVNPKVDVDRLTKLSNLQTHIIEHALTFPAARRVTYSTCSIHVLENEAVVARVLASEVAKSRGWRIMRREEQPTGLRKWPHRGIGTDRDPVSTAVNIGGIKEHETIRATRDLSEEELDACLRCWAGDSEGTSGFFVAGFIRDESFAGTSKYNRTYNGSTNDDGGDGEEEEEWEGFSD